MKAGMRYQGVLVNGMMDLFSGIINIALLSVGV